MKKIYFVLMMVFLVNGVWGQVNVSTSTSYQQNFDVLGTANITPWTDNSTLPGWYISTANLPINTGSSNTNGCYNFGAVGTNPLTDRALGAISTGTTHRFGLRLKNNGASSITSFNISFTGEQWRVNTAQTLTFEYQTAATVTSLTAGTWAAVTALDFASPTNTGGPVVDGNAPANRTAKSATVNVTVAAGNEIFFRWVKAGSNSPGLSIDDISIVPEPSVQASNILFGSVTTTSIPASWTNGNGNRRAVFMKEGAVGTITDPSDGVAYTPSTDWNVKGTQLGTSGYYCIADGVANSVTVTNLLANTNYDFQVFEYNSDVAVTASTINYFTATGTNNPLSQATQSAGGLTPPTLTAAVGATVDADFDITYADDAAWRSAVTVVKYGAATLTAGTDYDLATGILTLKPTGGNAALHVAGTQVVSVTATGYNDATVSQAIDAGAATQLGITTQPVAPATNGGVLVIQPVIAVQDQYGNTVTTSTAAITANVGAGIWSIGGTVLQNAAAGTGLATFTDLTATSAAAEAATIDFTSPGLTHIESSIFNIPAPPTLYTYIGTGTSSWANSANWSPTGVPTNQDEVLFNGATPVTITNVPSAALRTFTVTGSGAVTLQAAGAVTLNIGGGTTPQFSMASGSSLILDGNAAISVNIITGNTASVTGAITAQGGAHRLTAVDASGITFHNGAMFTAGTSFAGNPFGPSGATSNSVIFESGSTFIQKSGSNPFASSAPASIVVFQTGSLFKLQANLTPSLSGRTYANFEVDFASAVINGSGTAILNIDNLTVTQGSTSLGMTGGFNIKGDISVATGATLNLAPATAGTVTFAGASAQSINNSGTLTFGTNQSIVLNNANGLTLNTDVALGSAATLTLTNGSITLGNQTLTANSITGASATNYIRTTGTGSLALRNITTTTTFPVGNGISYTPAIITNTGTADDFAVNVATGTPCNADPNQSVNRVWTITEAVAGGSIADVTMQWNLAEENPTFTRLACAAVHCAGGVIDITGTNSTAGGGDPYTQTITGVSSFSPFGVTSDPVALPITIAYFRGGRQGNTNSLTWKVNCATSSRVTMTVERSGDGRTYAPINTITADGVRCLDAFVYNDIAPLPGLNYYKLKSVDIDGKITYSSIVTLLNKEKGFEIVNVTPNPGYGQFKLNVTTTERTTMEIVITDMQGRVVSKTTASLISGFNAIDLDAAKLPAGMYRVYGNTAAGNTKALSFVKQ